MIKITNSSEKSENYVSERMLPEKERLLPIPITPEEGKQLLADMMTDFKKSGFTVYDWESVKQILLYAVILRHYNKFNHHNPAKEEPITTVFMLAKNLKVLFNN